MKTILYWCSLALMVISFPTFADKVVITGSPIVLTHEGETYTLPAGSTTTTSYYYVTVDGSQKVCYLSTATDVPESLKALTAAPMAVMVDGKSVNWNCYPFDATYFEVTPMP